MLKELFETSFYYTYPPKEGVTVNLREQEFIGDGCLVDEIACQGCVDKCNANPLAREQFRFYSDKQTYVLSINKVLSFLDTDLGENCDYIIDNGVDTRYGARPLKRAIQTLLEDKLSKLSLEGMITDGCIIDASRVGDEIELSVRV